MPESDIYLNAAQSAWEDILGKVRELHGKGMKQEDIRRMLGIKSRSVISSWLSEGHTSANAAFPDMLRYLHILGLDVGKYVAPFLATPIDQPEDLTSLRTRVSALEAELQETRLERERALGQVELLRDLLREAQGGTVSPRKKALDASSSDSLTG